MGLELLTGHETPATGFTKIEHSVGENPVPADLGLNGTRNVFLASNAVSRRVLTDNVEGRIVRDCWLNGLYQMSLLTLNGMSLHAYQPEEKAYVVELKGDKSPGMKGFFLTNSRRAFCDWFDAADHNHVWCELSSEDPSTKV